MSSQGLRDFRPKVHFTPRKGWINDPNGLTYIDGKYHIFAQHYPYDTVWGPMHWYHAVSRDLLHWEHLPIALSPDELGFIFSGSAVLDRENTSGFGSGDKPPLVAIYTAHGEHEQQCIAWSTDYVHFTKYEGNPVIPNTKLPDFRDPKLFVHPEGGWGLAIAAGDRICFYRSRDLREWHKTGEFGPEGNHSEGVWECPDLFPMSYGGETVWVLLVSMGANRKNHGARTQYFLGRFDGERFICERPFDAPEFIDAGYDNYAAVTFSGTPQPLLLGWAANHVYAGEFPTGEYCCCFTSARTLSLMETPLGGLRLAATPAADPYGAERPYTGALPGEVFCLWARGRGAASICLENEAGQVLRFGVSEGNEVYLDRSRAGARGFHADFASDWYSRMSAPRFFDGPWELELRFDRSVAEIYGDGGSRVLTAVVFPDSPYVSVTAEGNVSLTIRGEAEA